MKIKPKKDKQISPKVLEKSLSLFKGLSSQKSNFVKRYGKDAEKVMKGTAINTAKKQIAKQNMEKIKSIIKEIYKQQEPKYKWESEGTLVYIHGSIKDIIKAKNKLVDYGIKSRIINGGLTAELAVEDVLDLFLGNILL